MRLKAVSGVMLTLLFVGVLTSASNTRVSESSEVHDMVILDVSPSSYAVYNGESIDINVTVMNNGTVAETFNVTVYYNDTAIDTQTVTDMPSNTNLTLTFVWDLSCLPAGTYLISANISSLVLGEIRRDDGYVEVWLWGDIDRDGDVDFFDLAKLILIYSGMLTPPPEVCIMIVPPPWWCDPTFFDLAKMILIYSGLLC